MSCLGVHFAITDEQRAGLEALPDDESRVHYVKETIEQAWEEGFHAESDKAWDGIHRALAETPSGIEYFYPVEGERHVLPEDHGSLPLKLCILGGKRLLQDEAGYFIRLVEPAQIPALSAALDAIEEPWFRERFLHHTEGVYPDPRDDDLEYCWAYFQDIRDFFRRMAGNGRAIIFTADQ